MYHLTRPQALTLTFGAENYKALLILRSNFSPQDLNVTVSQMRALYLIPLLPTRMVILDAAQIIYMLPA